MKKQEESLRLVSKSAVKEYLSKKELRTSGELLEKIDAWMEEALSRAAERCKSNGRATVRPEDL